MSKFFAKTKQQGRSAVLGLDLGASQIKATVVRRDGERVVLAEYALRKLPVDGKGPSKGALVSELQQLLGGLKTADRHAVVTVSCPSAMVCQADVPRMRIEEVRGALQLPSNCAKYLRRELVNYYLDVVEIPESGEEGKAKKPTMRVLVGGASRDEVAVYRDALVEAKVRPAALELTAVSVVNAFQVSHPELCEKEVVLLMDIGAQATTINLLRKGVPVMTRIMRFGGSQLSEHIARVLTLKPGEAEDQKLKMSEPVQALVKTALLPLAREVRASIDFFERQEECHVTKAFAGGGSATAAEILHFLSEEVGIKLERWDPLRNFDLGQVGGDAAALKSMAPTLGAAIGAAVGRLLPT